MKHKHTRSTLSFVSGSLVTLALFTAVTPALAALRSKNIDVYTGASIYIDGIELNPTDVNGKPVETFVYNGTTYVPLRAVSESLGKSVNWDGSTQSVYIGEVPGQKQYLLSVCPPYQKDGYNTPSTITMAGQKYANCIEWDRYSGQWAMFNLNGQYDTLEFDVGHIDGKGMRDGVLEIYLDNQLSFSLDLTAEMLPRHISVPLHNALQMKIHMGGDGDYYGLGNIEIY